MESENITVTRHGNNFVFTTHGVAATTNKTASKDAGKKIGKECGKYFESDSIPVSFINTNTFLLLNRFDSSENWL